MSNQIHNTLRYISYNSWKWKINFVICRYVVKSNYLGPNFQQCIRRNLNSTKNIYFNTKSVNVTPKKMSFFPVFSTFTILTGGTIFIVSNNQILCKPKTRMASYRTATDKNLEFDWQQFWYYLKPYLKYFICAILVCILLHVFISFLKKQFVGGISCSDTKYLYTKGYGRSHKCYSKIQWGNRNWDFYERCKKTSLTTLSDVCSTGLYLYKFWSKFLFSITVLIK